MRGVLFSKASFFDVEGHQEHRIEERISKLSEFEVAQRDFDSWLRQFESEFRIEPVVLGGNDTIEAKVEEIDIDVSGDPSRIMRDPSRPFYVKGALFKFFVPIVSGESDILQFRPSTRAMINSDVELTAREIAFCYRRADANAQDAQSEFDRELASVRQNTENLNKQIEQYNRALPDKIKPRLTRRFQEIESKKKAATDLGYKIRP